MIEEVKDDGSDGGGSPAGPFRNSIRKYFLEVDVPYSLGRTDSVLLAH